MRRLLAALALLALAAPLLAQVSGRAFTTRRWQAGSAAGSPSCSASEYGTLASFYSGANAYDILTGGGTHAHPAICTPDGWLPIPIYDSTGLLTGRQALIHDATDGFVDVGNDADANFMRIRYDQSAGVGSISVSGTGAQDIEITQATGNVRIGAATGDVVTIQDILLITPRASAPTCNAGAAGSVYTDSTGTDSLCFCDGSAWVNLSGGSGCA